MDPFFVVETALDFEQASSSLEAAVTSHGFGVLGIHDLGQTLRSKGIAFKEQCRGLVSAITCKGRKVKVVTDSTLLKHARCLHARALATMRRGSRN
jgi:hypothetical protein